eukprot:1180165-Prorocentrum_minimum.AAC.1
MSEVDSDEHSQLHCLVDGGYMNNVPCDIMREQATIPEGGREYTCSRHQSQKKGGENRRVAGTNR